MKLSDWLDSKNIKDATFGEAIGVARQAVHRYRIGERIPDKTTMAKIVAATDGDVTPNDFYAASAGTHSSEVSP